VAIAVSRYAIYFTPPPLSPLAVFGAAVLGYDSSSGADVPHLDVEGIAAGELAAATEAPRRYGFHATLVAPFHLEGGNESDLVEAVGEFCDRSDAVDLGSLQVGILGKFIALRPSADVPQLNELASRCVEFFDPFRLSLSSADRARRSNGKLSPRQMAYLDRWGYPYVFEEFRFHMTLTGSLDEYDQMRFFPALSETYQTLAASNPELDALSLARQRDSSSRFEVIARCTLRGAGGQDHEATG
jgi:putative phosphonate metabolism protein